MNYFSFNDLVTDYSFYIFFGGRGYEKYIYDIKQALVILFGGDVEIKYSFKDKCTTFILHNDDIGVYNFQIYDETMRHEGVSLRLRRMCEEYYAHMLYKYRDYKE